MIISATSPTWLTINAFSASVGAAGWCDENPTSKEDAKPTPSQSKYKRSTPQQLNAVQTGAEIAQSVVGTP